MATVTYTADPPSTRVTFVAADLNSSVDTITLYRLVGGASTAVRTAINLYANGGFTATDAEVPPGVPVTYQAQQFDASGNSLGWANAAPVTIPAPPLSTAWISDPLDETSSIKVMLTDTAGMSAKRTTSGTVYQVGATQVVLAGVQSLLQGVDMGFYTLSADDDARVLALLQKTNGLVLMRTAPGFGVTIPHAFYCFAGTASPTYQSGDGAQWDNTVSEYTPTNTPLNQASASWQTYINTFATWADFNAAYASWLDAEQNPPAGS